MPNLSHDPDRRQPAPAGNHLRLVRAARSGSWLVLGKAIARAQVRQALQRLAQQDRRAA